MSEKHILEQQNDEITEICSFFFEGIPAGIKIGSAKYRLRGKSVHKILTDELVVKLKREGHKTVTRTFDASYGKVRAVYSRKIQ
jgi:hypothetical protein